MRGTLEAVLTPTEVKELLEENPRTRLLDVRTPGEYESVRIRGAYNVPLDSLGEHASEIRARIEDPVVLICQSGGRALRAEAALREAGMPNLHVLDGGVKGWIAAGEGVHEGTRRISLERQIRILAGAVAATGGVLAVAVNPHFGLVAAAMGGGLAVAGLTDTCLMGIALSKLSYNRHAACDVEAMVRALTNGTAPAAVGRPADAGTTAARGSCPS